MCDREEIYMSLWPLAAKYLLRVYRNLHLNIHSELPFLPYLWCSDKRQWMNKSQCISVLNWTSSNVGCKILKDPYTDFKTIAYNTIFYLCQLSRKIMIDSRMRVIREHHQKGVGVAPLHLLPPYPWI